MGNEEQPAASDFSPRQAVLDRLEGETRAAVIEATESAYTAQDDIWVIVLMVMAAIDQRNDAAASAIDRAVGRIGEDDKAIAEARASIRADLAKMDGQLSETFDTLRRAVETDLRNERHNVDAMVQKAVYASIEHHIGRAIPKQMDRYSSILTSVNLGKAIAVIGGSIAVGFLLGVIGVLAAAGLGANGIIG